MTRCIGRWLWIALWGLAFSLQAALPPNHGRIHYHRRNGDYAGWGLHIWGAKPDLVQDVTWDNPLMPSGQDSFGIYFDIPFQSGSGDTGFILHRGNTKNVRPDMAWEVAVQGPEIWQLEGDATVYLAPPRIDADHLAAPGPAPKALRAAAADAGPAQPKARPEAMGGLEAALFSEQQARQIAELTLKQREQSLAQIQEASRRAEAGFQDQVQNLSLQLLDARRQAGARPWPTLMAASLLLLGLTLLWRSRGIRHKQRLAALLAQIDQAEERMKKEREERHSAEQRIAQLANFDELTGLPNRAILNQNITQALAKFKRFKKHLAVLFIDLDRFKLINDTMGHDAGDDVLKTIAERFKGCLRDSDTIARVGGDEFVVLVEDLADPKAVAGVAQKLVAVAQQTFLIQGQECHVSASIGISTYPGDAKDAGNLLKNADIAMYRAKEHGKNNFQYYSEQMNLHSLQRLALESSLRHALERKELRLHYQPIIDTVGQRIVGLEALVRWQHPDMGMVGPLQFIPIAEETGLIGEIGGWVLETACRQGARWRAMGHLLTLSVNLSPRQLNQGNLVSEFRRTFEETGFPASQLILEITESLMLGNPDETVVLLHELKDLGVRIAIDDFGTGYSSLAYLRHFPIDTLKIDRSFLQDIPSDADSAALTAAVIALGHSLRLDVVAEGVEAEAQRDFLLEHKCGHMQGYLFSRPKPADEITALLASQAHDLQAMERP